MAKVTVTVSEINNVEDLALFLQLLELLGCDDDHPVSPSGFAGGGLSASLALAAPEPADLERVRVRIVRKAQARG